MKSMDRAVKPNRIELEGEYDLSRKEELDSLFATLTTDRPATIDLSRVTYIDSTVLNLLATLHFRLRPNIITLKGVSPAIRRLLNIVKFDQLFNITEA